VCFYVRIYSSETKLFTGGSKPLLFSVEIVPMLRQDSVLAELRYYFSPLHWGIWSSSHAFTQCSRIWIWSQHYSDQGKLVRISCGKVSCLLLGCIYYRSFSSLCTGSHCWPQGTLHFVGQTGRHLLHMHLSLCFRNHKNPHFIWSLNMREWMGRQRSEFYTD
jgi:hypothetical protein